MRAAIGILTLGVLSASSAVVGHGAEIPIRRHKHYLITEAVLGPIKAHFILDTGSNMGMVSMGLLGKFIAGIAKGDKNFKETIYVPDKDGLSGQIADDFTLAGERTKYLPSFGYHKKIFSDALMANNFGTDCDGIIGMNVLGNFIVDLDIKHSKLGVGSVMNISTSSFAVALNLRHEKGQGKFEPVIYLSKDGGPSHPFLIDTGADGIIVTSKVAREWGIAVKGTASKWNGADTTTVKVSTLSLDQFPIRNAEMHVTDEDELPWDSQGFLGMKILEQFERIVFDFPNGKVYLGTTGSN